MTPDLMRAKARLAETNSTCVLCRGEDEVTSQRRGVAPLLGFLDEHLPLTGFSAADRVVGKAAAFLYIRLGVTAVYAPVMSRPAFDTLTTHGVPAFYDTLTEAIINRTGDGHCPMETAVWEITDPAEAETAIRERLAELTHHKI
ncbi:MAG: DUF1893 domain-containing protein [Clostridia bacterium]|nr:DUF1893 domain-containing protein [Clostridia bacterium]